MNLINPSSGAVFSVLAFIGVYSRICLFGAWLFFLSLVSCGGDFIFFPWDFLLLESGFLALFLPSLELLPYSIATHYPPLHIICWAYKYLLFRYSPFFSL